MKQTFRLLSQFSTLLFFTLLLFNSLHAFATNIPASNGSIPLFPTTNTFSSVQTLNSDMIDIPYVGKLTAVVYDGYSVTNSRQEIGLRVDFNGSPVWVGVTDVIGTTGQYINPDVAIIDQTSGTLGEDYRILVSLENVVSNRIEIWEAIITDVGALTPTYTAATLIRFIPNTNGAAKMSNPHIDAAGDVSMLISNVTYGALYYGSDDFVVSWEEHSGSLPGIWASPYNYKIGLTANNPVQVFSGFAEWSDVGCRGHYTLVPSSASYTAYISFVDSISRIIHVGVITADKSGTVYMSGGSFPVSSGTSRPDYGYPRIEARRIGDVTTNVATWEIVAAAYPGTGFWEEIHAFNDVTGQTTFSLNTGVNHYKPAVTGVGQENSATGVVNFGSEKFTVSYYSDDASAFSNPNGDYVSNFVDINGGTPTNADYYQVQNYALNQVFTPTEPCIAVSTSSNTGDSLFTVYYDGYNTTGDIMYKFTGNSIGYKTGTTGINNINAERNYVVFPNPATTTLTVNGTVKADYTIVDIVGKTVATGTISNSNNTVAIEKLTPGNYLLNLSENGHTTIVKFVKQ